MQQLDLPILKKEALKPTLWEITLAGTALNALNQPGQFFLVQCADPFSAYLRRAIFPSSTASHSLSKASYLSKTSVEAETPSTLQFTLTAHETSDSGLAWLLSRQAGDKVNVLGPFGKGFSLPTHSQNLLLIGQGAHILPLLQLAELALSKKMNVVLALEVFSERDLYPAQAISPAIELRLVSRDGKQGQKGNFLDNLADLPTWADSVCALGSQDFLRSLKTLLQDKRLFLTQGFAQALITDAPLHICGVGSCQLCAIRTSKGMRLACTNGPVFDLTDLE